MLTIIFLLIFTLTDLYKRIIPNSLLALMFLVSLLLHQNTLLEFFTALLISTIFIITLYKLKFFAGGDAKLLIILGAIAGYPNLFYLFAIIFIIGGFQAITNKIFEAVPPRPYQNGTFWRVPKQREGEVRLLKILRTLQRESSTKKHLPYALSILLGYILFSIWLSVK